MQLDNQSYKEWSFGRICKVQLCDENKNLMDKSILEKYRKFKCCVFINFEYMLNQMVWSNQIIWVGIVTQSNERIS